MSKLFDYISIDFETANKNRVSACALGLAFVKGNEIIKKQMYFIKPPVDEKFSSINTRIHGIKQRDVNEAKSFQILWNETLRDNLNNNLIVYHNASMDLSVLKNLFKHYSIEDYKIKHIDSMRLAEKLKHPKKLVELAKLYNITFENRHNPTEDAEVCALIFNKLINEYSGYTDLIKILDQDSDNVKKLKNEVSDEIINQNIGYIKNYSINANELSELKIEGSSFIFTGESTFDRGEAKDFIKENAGVIKSSISGNLDFVVLSEDYGWAKVQKIHSHNEKKGNIKILSDSDFLNLKARFDDN